MPKKLKKHVSGESGEGQGGEEVQQEREFRKPRKWRQAEHAEDWRISDLERRNVVRYRYVKFVEKTKVERKMKTCKRLLEAALKDGKEDEVACLREQLKSHLADHEYITYYPKHLPYTSLFPTVDSKASAARRTEIRKMIRNKLTNERSQSDDQEDKALEEDEAVSAKARKAKAQSTPGGKAASASKVKTAGTNSKKAKKDKLRDTEASATSTSKVKTAGINSKKAKKDKLQDTAASTKAEKVKEEVLVAEVKRAKGKNDSTGNIKEKKKAVSGKKDSLKKKAVSLEKSIPEQEEPTLVEASPAKRKRSAKLEAAPASQDVAAHSDLSWPKKKKRRAETASEHPSWSAKKVAKVSGAMVKSQGDRKVFESDSED